MKIFEYKDISFIVGENSHENWNLLELYNNLNEKYIWFHLDSFPSCFVFMLSEDIMNTDLLNYGALLCKNNTKYKNLKNIKICYTTINKLKKTENIGEVNIIGKKKIIKY